MIISTQVSGIPCQVRVTHCFVQKPMGQSASNDLDCYGYEEVEYDILDRKGRPAPWLERKKTPKDNERIVGEILEAMGDEE